MSNKLLKNLINEPMAEDVLPLGENLKERIGTVLFLLQILEQELGLIFEALEEPDVPAPNVETRKSYH